MHDLLSCASESGSGGSEVFPIPAISTSKNDGSDFGLIVPALFTGPDGDLKYLVAPMVVHNSFVGTRGTINLFRYEPGGKELRGIASWSERIERKFLLSYVDPGFSDGRYSIGFSAMHFKNATMRFWAGADDRQRRPNELHGF